MIYAEAVLFYGRDTLYQQLLQDPTSFTWEDYTSVNWHAILLYRDIPQHRTNERVYSGITLEKVSPKDSWAWTGTEPLGLTHWNYTLPTLCQGGYPLERFIQTLPALGSAFPVDIITTSHFPNLPLTG